MMVEVRSIPVSSILSCPLAIMSPRHYDEDNKCLCEEQTELRERYEGMTVSELRKEAQGMPRLYAAEKDEIVFWLLHDR